MNKFDKIYFKIIKEDNDMQIQKSSEKMVISFKKMLDSIQDEVVGIIDDYHKIASTNYPNFPVVDVTLLEWHIKESDGYALLDSICNDHKDLEDIRSNWLMKVGKDVVGEDFIDFSNLTEEDEKYLKTEYTYFEDSENQEDIVKKYSVYTKEEEPLFDEETGEISNPERYEYLGKGMVKDKKTGETYNGTEIA